MLFIEIIYPLRTSGPFPSLNRVAGAPITHISIQLPQILEDRELTLKPSDATWNLQRDNNQIALSGSQLEEGQTLSLHIDVKGFIPAGTYPVTFQTLDTEGHTSMSSTSWIIEVNYLLQIYSFFLSLQPMLEPLLYILTPLLGAATLILIMMPEKAPPTGLPGPSQGLRESVPGHIERDDTHDIKDTCDSHHCAGHRLLVIIGSKKDKTIGATLKWALKLKNVNHMVWFKESGKGGKLNNPYLPNSKKSGWEKYKKPISFDCCCFFEEMMVMTHGSPGGRIIHKRIIEKMPAISGGRPIKKLVLWMCNSSMDIYPDASYYGMTYFNEYCGIIAPRKCPCNCDLKLCMIRCKDPEGSHPIEYRCPDITDPTKMYLAGWHTETGAKGKDLNIASILGIAPENASQPLTSPDGHMREVTITAKEKKDEPGYDYNAKTKPKTDEKTEVFNGIIVRPDIDLTITEKMKKELNDRIKRVREAADDMIKKKTKKLRPGTKAYVKAVKKVKDQMVTQIENLKRLYKNKRLKELAKKNLSIQKMNQREKTVAVKLKEMTYTGPKCKCPDRDGCLEKAV